MNIQGLATELLFIQTTAMNACLLKIECMILAMQLQMHASENI